MTSHFDWPHPRLSSGSTATHRGPLDPHLRALDRVEDFLGLESFDRGQMARGGLKVLQD